MKVLKVQIYAVENFIIHHLIGNAYFTYDTDMPLNDVVELPGRCIPPSNYIKR